MVSEEKLFESVDGRRTDDGGFPYYKLPRSLRLRGAKKGKSAGVDNIPADLVQADGETMVDVLQRSVTGSGELIITFPNKTSHRDRIARLTAPCPSHKKLICKNLTFC